MEKTIIFNIPEGYVIDKENSTDTNIILKFAKSVKPKTWKEFCAQNKIKKGECSIDIYGDIIEDSSVGANRDHNYYKNTLPNKQAAKAHLALMQLHQLRDCYRQGWVPNLTIPKSNFAIFYTKGKYSIEEFIYSSEFLSFQSKEIAEEFLNNFKDLIEQAGDLI